MVGAPALSSLERFIIAAPATFFSQPPCYIRKTCGLRETLSAHRAGSSNLAESVELCGPLRAVCGATAGAERVPAEQYAGRLSYQRVPSVLYGGRTLCRASSRSLFAQENHRRRRHLLERPDPAHRGHAYLHRVIDSPHAGGNWRSNVRNDCSNVRCRSVSGRKAWPHSGSLLPGDSCWNCGRIFAWRPSQPALRLAISFLRGGGAGVSARAGRTFPARAQARTVRSRTGNSGAGYVDWPGA